MNERWYEWAQTIQSIAQAGLEYSRDPFDRDRFQQLRQLSVEIVAEHTELTTETVTGLFANETGYQTPKVDVRAAVPNEGTVLFVQEIDGKWALPGGWAEPMLSLKENARKEVLEESGLRVEPASIIAILDRNRHVDDDYPYSVYKVFIACKLLGGNFVPNLETNDARFFGRHEIPELSQTRTTLAQVMMCFDHLERNDGAVIFD